MLPPNDVPDSAPTGILVRISTVAALVVAVALLVPWGVLIWWRLADQRAGQPQQTGPVTSTNSAAVAERTTQSCKPGPWGELEFTRILIEPPAEFVLTRFPDSFETRWVLPGATLESVSLLLATLPFTEAQRRELLSAGHMESTSAGIVLTPSRDFVLSLSPELRERWYKILGEYPANLTQFKPARIRADVADEWFVDSDLTPAAIALVKKLVYRRGGALLFSDQTTVMPLLASDAERSVLVKTLARKAALLVKLRLRPGADIDHLVQYWSRAGRSKDIEPLLRSLPKQPQGFTLDVAHLLPQFARARLYTYPAPQPDADPNYRDCHWTSLNFFAAKPDDRFGDPRVVSETLARDYYQVTGDPAFGDVVLFVNERSETKHSCVYVADDIVFTKNGGDSDVPWILMQLSDLVPWYGVESPVELRAYRARRE